HYDETVDEEYLQEHTISSSLEGFYNEIKKDPDAEKKYFTNLYLDDWDSRVSWIAKPVVNWMDPTKKWVGDPVEFLSIQVGYPRTDGSLEWKPKIFQSTDTVESTNWAEFFNQKKASDVTNPPQNWSSDKKFVKRVVHLMEPPGEDD